MENEQPGPGEKPEEQDMPHGHEGSDRPGGQVGVGVGGLGGGQPGGTQSDKAVGTARRAGVNARAPTVRRKPHTVTRAATGARAARSGLAPVASAARNGAAGAKSPAAKVTARTRNRLNGRLERASRASFNRGSLARHDWDASRSPHNPRR